MKEGKQFTFFKSLMPNIMPLPMPQNHKVPDIRKGFSAIRAALA